MTKKILLYLIMLQWISTSALAGDIEAMLTTNDGSTTFEVLDSGSTIMFSVDSDGNTTWPQGATVSDLTVPTTNATPNGVITAPEGSLAYDTTGNMIYLNTNGGTTWTELTTGGAGGGTLDQSYDFGGAGVGRAITVDTGAVQLTGSNAADETLEVSNSAAGGVILVTNGGTGDGITLDQNGNGIALDVDSEATTVDIVNLDGSTLTTGNAIQATVTDAFSSGSSLINVVATAVNTATNIIMNQLSTTPANDVDVAAIHIERGANDARILYDEGLDQWQLDNGAGGGLVQIATGAGGSGDVTAVGDCASGDCFTAAGTGDNLTGATNDDIISLSTDATFTFQRNDAGTVTFIGADNAGAADTVYDTTGAGAITVGSADVTAVTVTTDGTGTAEVVLPNDSVDTNEILDNTITATNLNATLTFSDADLLDLSAINASTTTEGLFLPQANDVSAATAEGQISWDADNDQLVVGTNGGQVTLGTGSGDVTAVGNCATGACFGGASGNTLTSTTSEVVDLATDATFEFQRNDAGAVTFLGADDAGAADTVYDTTGAGAITVGSADVTSVTVTTDSTGDGEVSLPGESVGASEVTTDSLDFAQFEDTLDLDAALTLNQTTNTWSQTFTGTTTTGLTYTASSLTSGRAVDITSNSADTTVRTLVQMTNDNAAATGAVVLGLQQDSTGNTLSVDHNGATGNAITIDGEQTTGDLLNLDGSVLTTGNLIQGTVVDTVNSNTALINITGTALDTATLVKVNELSTTAANDVDVAAIHIERGANDARIVYDEGLDQWQLDQGAGAGLVAITTGAGASGDITTVGDCTTGDCFTAAGTGDTLTGATNDDVISLSTDATFTFQRNDAGTVTFIGADNAGAADTVYDTTGAGAITVGSADVTSVTVTTDSTGDGEVSLPGESIGASEVTTDSLDFAQFEDTLDLDAALTLNQTTNTWSQTFTGLATTGISYVGDSLTSGTLLSLTSNSADTTARTLVQMTNDNSAATGAVVLGLQQDSTGNTLSVDHNGTTGNAINIDGEQTTADLLNLDGSALTTGSLIQGAVTDTLNTDVALINITGTALDTATLVKVNELSTTPANDVDVAAIHIERGANDARIVYDEGTDTWQLDQGAGAGLVQITTGAAATGDITTVGDCTTGDCFTAAGTGDNLTGATNDDIISLSTDATFTFQRNDAGTVTFIGADNAGAADTVYDTTGAGAITVGSADVTSVTVTTDSTGDAEVSLPGESVGASEVTTDSLDFAQFEDTLDLDAALTLNQTTNTWSQTFTGTTTTGLTYTASSLTSGQAVDITSNSADTTARTLVQMTNDNAAATGAVVLGLQQDSTGNTLSVDHNGATGNGITIDGEQTTGDLLNLDGSVLTTGNLIQGTVVDTVNTDTALINITGTALDTATLVKVNELSTTPANDVDVAAIHIERGANDARIVYDEGLDQWQLDQGAGAGLVQITTGAAATGDITTVGDCTTGDCFTAAGTGDSLTGATNDDVISLATDATFTFQRNDAGTVTFIGADNAGAADTVYDTTGAGAITVGSADVTSVTVTTDSTGDAEVSLPGESVGASEVTTDSLDFAQFQDTLDLDAALTLNQTTNTWSQTFTGTTTTGLSYAADSLTSGTLASLTSNSADTTARTLIQMTNDNAAATGAVVLGLQQDSTGNTLSVDHNGATGNAITVDGEQTTEDLISLDGSVLTTGNLVQGLVADTVNTDTAFINITGTALDTATLVKVNELSTTAVNDVDVAAIHIERGANDARIVFDEGTDTWQLDQGAGAGLVSIATGAAGNTLDQAYDQGGAGAGRSITADSGAVAITVTNTSNNVGLSVTQNDTTNNPSAFTVANTGTGDGVSLTQTGNGIAADISSSATSSDGINLSVSAMTTGTALDIPDLDSVSSGRALNIASNSGDNTARTLAQITNSNGTATGAVLLGLQQDATANSLFIDHNGTTGNAINIDGEQSTDDIIDVDGTALSTGDGLQITVDSTLTTGRAIRVLGGAGGATEIFNVSEDGTAIAADLIFTPSATEDISAANGITATELVTALLRIQGDGGAVDITASPQIADGTDGQIIVLQGDSNTNTVKLDDGNGLELAGGISFTMGQRDTLTLTYDSGDDLWIEISRSDF